MPTELAILIVIGFALWAIVEFTIPDRTYCRPFKTCEDDRTKVCPYRYYVTKNGGFGVDTSDLVRCCKFKKQLDAFREIERMQRKDGG